MSEFKLRSIRVRVVRWVALAAIFAMRILPSFERSTLIRASRRLRIRIATAAPRDLSRSAGEVILYVLTRVRRLSFSLVFGLVATGCHGPFVAVAHVDPTSAKTLENQVQIYHTADLATAKYATLGELEATSSKNKLWDPAATEAGAISQLRFKAFTRHANGLILWGCDSYGTQLSTNCWSSITCRATMIDVQQPITE